MKNNVSGDAVDVLSIEKLKKKTILIENSFSNCLNQIEKNSSWMRLINQFMTIMSLDFDASNIFTLAIYLVWIYW